MKTLIFDFDGTLADSFSTLLSIFEQVTERPHPLTQQEIKQLRGSTLKEIIGYLQVRKWHIPGKVLRAKRLMAARISSLKTFDGIHSALKELHNEGYSMYILSTNSPSNINEFLHNNNLGKYFHNVYGDVGLRGKASAIRKILKREGLHPADCVYIGDEVRDVAAAKKARVRSIAVGWGFNYPEALAQAGPWALAKNPSDLPRLLK